MLVGQTVLVEYQYCLCLEDWRGQSSWQDNRNRNAEWRGEEPLSRKLVCQKSNSTNVKDSGSITLAPENKPSQKDSKGKESSRESSNHHFSEAMLVKLPGYIFSTIFLPPKRSQRFQQSDRSEPRLRNGVTGGIGDQTDAMPGEPMETVATPTIFGNKKSRKGGDR